MENERYSDIEAHYHSPGLLERILGALRELGRDPGRLEPEDLAAVDEFHVRGAAVSRELAGALNPDGLRVLDVGCGLGGPARMLAADYGCAVSGIDLSPEFIRTARELTRLSGLSGQVNLVCGDARELPYPDGEFDVVWTQHVQMNILDKVPFYGELRRVLRPGGRLAYYDIFRTGTANVTYPMPWAASESQSFLISRSQLHECLEALGFSRLRQTDQTPAGIEFFRSVFDRIAREGMPALGLHLVMGPSAGDKLRRLLSHLEDGTLELESAIWQWGSSPF